MIKTLISDGIMAQAEKHPDKPAVIGIDEDGANYTDVVRLYAQTKAFLSALSVGCTERIAIFTENGIVYSILAIPVIEHAVLVPLDPEMSREKLAFFFKFLQVDYVLTDQKSGTVIEIAQEQELSIILIKYCGGMGNLNCSFELWRKGVKKSRPADSTCNDTALIKTTSGTTSTPKIVPKTYSAIHNTMQRNIKEYHHNEKDIYVVIAQMHQTYSFNKVMLTLSTGGTAIVTNGFRHREFIDLINRNRVTWFGTSPAVLNSLAAYLEESGTIVESHSLRFILSSGAPLTEKIRAYYQKTFDVPVVESYGMTETGIITSTYQLPKGYKAGSVGVSTGLEIKILHGEILVRGDSVFHGYENSEESSHCYFIDGWFRTGDQGYLDEDGYLFITGRFKEMINRGGEKVSPYEVEKAILRHEAVTEAVVFPIPNNYGSEDVGTAVVLKEGQHINIIELRGFLQGLISAYKMPTQLYVVEEIPYGENRKVQRRLLNEELEKRYPDQIDEGGVSTGKGDDDSREVLSATEKIVLEIWKKVLKKQTIRTREDFFVMGGDSLKMALVYSELERILGIQVSINALFHKTTIKDLSAYIDSKGMFKSGYKYLVPIKETGNKAPLFCIHSVDGEVMTYHSLGEFMEEDHPVYGLRFVPEGIEWKHPLNFEQLGAEYAREIQVFDPYGPYNLCGNCLGGVLAFAVAQVLVGNGKKSGYAGHARFSISERYSRTTKTTAFIHQ